MPSQPHWDMGPVLRLWGDRPIVELARSTGIAHRQFVRWLRAGVPDRSADRLAIALGLGPELVWPEWYAGAGSPEIVDYTAAGVVKAAYLRRVATFASDSAKPPPKPHPAEEPAIRPEPRPPAPEPALAPVAALSTDRRSAPANGYSDDLVWIRPDWLANTPDPAGLPPRKEGASCRCSRLDDLGRPPIGWCGPSCERRPA